MGNPILFVQNAGFGETPVPDDALIQPGTDLNIHDANDGSQKVVRCIAVVPARGCIEYAIADQNKKPRPLMVRDNRKRCTLYVLDFDGREVLVDQKTMARGLKKAADQPEVFAGGGK